MTLSISGIVGFMKSIVYRFVAGLLVITMTFMSISCKSAKQSANTTQPSNTAGANSAMPDNGSVQAVKFTDEELDHLLAPIALYPDPLLAQMIPAATFVDQIKEAQQHLNGKADDSLIANQDWDVSVKSIAHYPSVLKKMADDIDWTTTLGQAYINQPYDVGKAIQRLRLDARDAGNLVSTPQQKVTEKDNTIRIEPAEPKVIYVPEYDPETVYMEEPEDNDGVSTGTAVAIGAIAFSAGLLIGSWLNRDYDYNGYYGRPGIYYHGWSGPGWIGVNRRYVDVDINRNVYINDSFRNINVNRNVIDRNVVAYRGNLTRDAAIRSQRVTNARVNRQLNRGPGRVDSGAVDRNRGPGIGSGPDRNRDLNPGGDRSRVGGRKEPVRNSERRDISKRDTTIHRRPEGGERQRPGAAPRQNQKQAPNRGGTGGRRRG